MTFAFAAAGTGGHIYPALAVAEALVSRGVDRSDIVFFGGDRLEATVVPEAGFELIALELRGLERRVTTRNLGIPALVLRAAKTVEKTLAARETRAVLGMGGYVTVPAIWGARRAGATPMIHEQNAVPGLANRLVARFSRRVFAAFGPATARLRRAEVVGNPLRPAFATFDRDALRQGARERYGLGACDPVVGILGGSQGAKALNELAPVLRSALPEGAGLLHLSGRPHLEHVQHAAAGSHGWAVNAFEPAMEQFYAACDVIICRAGALTMSEVASTCTPAVVVPYPGGTGGHQKANAASLEEAGGVVVIPEERLTDVVAQISSLLADPRRLGAMADSLRPLAHPDAAATIAHAMLAEVS